MHQEGAKAPTSRWPLHLLGAFPQMSRSPLHLPHNFTDPFAPATCNTTSRLPLYLPHAMQRNFTAPFAPATCNYPQLHGRAMAGKCIRQVQRRPCNGVEMHLAGAKETVQWRGNSCGRYKGVRERYPEKEKEREREKDYVNDICIYLLYVHTSLFI